MATTFKREKNAIDNSLVQAVARGIGSVDFNHIHTVELNYSTSGSLQDPSWAPLIELNAAYTYFPTYAQVLTEYNRPNFKPVIMVEANYEFEQTPYTDGGSAQNLRRQEYWTMLSGATGQLYGSAHTWPFWKEWESNLDTPGVRQLSYMKNLFASVKWYDLIADQTHTVVTAGYGRFFVSCWNGPGLFWTRPQSFVYSKRACSSAKAFRHRVDNNQHLRDSGQDFRWICGDGISADRPYDYSRYVETRSHKWPIYRRRRLNRAGDGDWVLVLQAAR
jgi:hypothetical protein